MIGPHYRTKQLPFWAQIYINNLLQEIDDLRADLNKKEHVWPEPTAT